MPEKPPYDPSKIVSSGFESTNSVQTSSDKPKPKYDPNKIVKKGIETGYVEPNYDFAPMENIDKENQLENTLNDIVKTSRRSISDGEKDLLRDMLSNPNITGEQAKESIQAMQGYHPKQEQSVYGIDPAYYVKADENGVVRPIPLSKGERPPKEFQVENVWGQTKKQAQDDSWYTDLTKSLFNALPSLAMGASDIGNFVSLAVTGEESEFFNRAKSTSESLKMFKDDNGGKTLYNTDGVKEIGDLVSSERFDVSPEALWNTVNWAAESLPQFLIGAGVAGRGIQGAKFLVGLEGALGSAGQKASLFAASTAMQLGENMEAAKEAGLTGREIAQYAGPVTAIQASLDAFTGLDIGATLFSRGYKDASKTLVKNFAKQLTKEADGTLTKESLKKVGREFAMEYGNLSKEYAKVAMKDLGGEMLQESLQDVTTKAGQQIWDNLTSEDKAKFGTDALSAKSFASYLSNGINSLGVAPVTAISAKQKYNEQSNEALKIIEQGKDKVDEFKANIYQAERRGDITEDERNHAINKIDRYQIYSEQVKDLPNMSKEEKKEAFELSFNIDALKSEVNRFSQEDIAKLDPIAKAKIEAKETLAKDLQKDLNRILLKQSVPTETKVGDETVAKLAKEFEPKKEGEKKPMTLKELNEKLGGINPKETEKLDLDNKTTEADEDVMDFEVDNIKSMARRPISKFTTVGWNKMAESNPTRAKAIVQEELKTKPNNQMKVTIKSGKHRTYTFDIGENKQVKAAQSVVSGQGKDYFKYKNLPEKRVNVVDRGGNTVLDEAGEPEFYYEDQAVMKRLDFPSKDKDGNPMTKAVLAVYNEKTGEFISFAREHRKGKSVQSEADKYHLDRLYNSNLYNEAMMEKYSYEKNKIAAPKDSKVEEPAVEEQEEKPTTKEPKVKKPTLKLEQLPNNLLDKNVFTIVEDETTGEQEKVSVKLSKLQAAINKKFKMLEKVNKCIHG